MVVDGFNHLGRGAGRRPSAGRGATERVDRPPAAGGDTALVRFGLCDTCVHQRIVRNTRGSVFSLCRRSKTDPRFPRYPRVPVLECWGHESHASTDKPDGRGVPRRA
jgi:hypothetical protein